MRGCLIVLASFRTLNCWRTPLGSPNQFGAPGNSYLTPAGARSAARVRQLGELKSRARESDQSILVQQYADVCCFEWYNPSLVHRPQAVSCPTATAYSFQPPATTRYNATLRQTMYLPGSLVFPALACVDAVGGSIDTCTPATFFVNSSKGRPLTTSRHSYL